MKMGLHLGLRWRYRFRLGPKAGSKSGLGPGQARSGVQGDKGVASSANHMPKLLRHQMGVRTHYFHQTMASTMMGGLTLTALTVLILPVMLQAANDDDSPVTSTEDEASGINSQGHVSESDDIIDLTDTIDGNEDTQAYEPVLDLITPPQTVPGPGVARYKRLCKADKR